MLDDDGIAKLSLSEFVRSLTPEQLSELKEFRTLGT